MPKIERVEVLDDLEYRGGAEDGKEVEATETRDFTVGGQTYRTYLSAENAARFDDDMAVWTEFAEKVTASGPTRARRASSGGGSSSRKDRSETAEIREWAKGQNFEPPVSEKGRIPDKVTEAYYAAHPERRPAA